MENAYKTLDKAAIYLEHEDSGFVIIEANAPVLQQQAAAYLTGKVSSKKILAIDLKTAPRDATHLSVIRQKASENPDVSVFLILNFHTLADRIETKEIGLVRDLNFSREPYASLNKILVFFLPSFFVDLLIRHARDFYDYVPIKFELVSEDSGALIWQNKPTDTADEIFLGNRILFLRDMINSGELSEGKKAEKLFELAKSHGKLYQHDEAIQRYQQALVFYQKLKDRRGEALALKGIGLIHFSRSEYETAMEYLKQALSICQEIRDQVGESTILSNISLIFKARGEYDTALEYLKQSLNIAGEIGDRVSEGLSNISLIYQARGEYETALEYLKQSLSIRREIGDRAGEGATLNNIALIYRTWGKYEKGLEYLEQSLSIAKEIENRAGEAATLNNISQIYQARGDYETAMEYLKQSLSIGRELGDRAGLCITLINMGNIHWTKEEKDQAMSEWREAYQIAREIGHAQALAKLDELAKQLGGKDLTFIFPRPR